MKRYVLSVLAGAALGYGPPAQLHAQVTGMHQFANRKEGFLTRPNSGMDYEVLGVFGSDTVGGSPMPRELHIAFYQPAGDSVERFWVRTVQTEALYAMEPAPGAVRSEGNGWMLFQGWPTADVLEPSRIRLSDLAVSIRLADPSVPNVFAPAFFFGDGAPAAVRNYVVELVVFRQLESAPRCLVIDSRGSRVDSSGKAYTCTFGHPGDLGRARPMELLINAAPLPEGVVTVHISGDYLNDESSRLNADVHFLHHASPPGAR